MGSDWLTEWEREARFHGINDCPEEQYSVEGRYIRDLSRRVLALAKVARAAEAYRAHQAACPDPEDINDHEDRALELLADVADALASARGDTPKADAPGENDSCHTCAHYKPDCICKPGSGTRNGRCGSWAPKPPTRVEAEVSAYTEEDRGTCADCGTAIFQAGEEGPMGNPVPCHAVYGPSCDQWTPRPTPPAAPTEAQVEEMARWLVVHGLGSRSPDRCLEECRVVARAVIAKYGGIPGGAR